jgi:RES domain-containing protein
VRVWRICQKIHQAFDGEGARLCGGRWNRPGAAMVYASATLSLAALESVVHLDPEEEPENLVAVSAEIPENLRIRRIAIGNLPQDWRQYPAPESLQEIGTAWIRSASTAVLAVPSAVIPQEWNYLLNPAHPDFKKIRLNKAKPFQFDPRLWK